MPIRGDGSPLCGSAILRRRLGPGIDKRGTLHDRLTALRTSGDVLLTAADVDRAVAEGVIGSSDATNLLAWARERATANPSAAHAPAHLPVEQLHGTESGHGRLLLRGAVHHRACGWFLGDKWDALGAQGVLATALIYAIVLASVGVLLLRAGLSRRRRAADHGGGVRDAARGLCRRRPRRALAGDQLRLDDNDLCTHQYRLQVATW